MSSPREDQEPHAGADALPEHLEDRAYEVLLASAGAERDAAFAALLAEHPAHRAALLRLGRRLRSAESALADTGLAAEAAPTEIGPYAIVRKLGEGGFGVVWLAEQSQPIRRQVAIKLIRPGMDTASVLRRFDAERDLLARFDHPCINRVLDAGVTANGQPYLVTEYVPGEPLVAYAERRGLPLRARVALLQKVAEAVQHAHQRGVIHRDLKPSNVLVVELEGVPWPKVIDFGVARALAEHGVGGGETRPGGLIGTPEYMSPEQALGERDVDVRTDVYALGVMLFELLVGDLPHGRERWRRASLGELVDRLRRSEAPRPSAVVADPVLARQLRGDLDWIVTTALASDRARRYPSARTLAADLADHLANRPIAAGPPSRVYQLRKFVRRHRGEVAAAMIALLSLVGGLIASLVALQRARSAEHASSAIAEERRQTLLQFTALADVMRERDLRRRFGELWPARPERAPLFRGWIDAARDLVGGAAARAAVAAAAHERATTDGAAAVLAENLAQLERALLAFTEPRGFIAQAADGLAWAGRVEQATVSGPAARWREAIDAIAASPRYGGMRLQPQLGLSPLGFDPESGLYEFLHAQSGAAPRRDANGRLAPDETSGIVFVLLPGGRASVGAQRDDPSAPLYDPLATHPNATVHTVDLEPFFLAKHEVSRAQWHRVGMSGGAYFELGTQTGQGPLSELHPAENLCWDDAAAFARRCDAALPTDAQWEYACRAGTTTIWHTGDDPASLRRFANIAGTEIGDLGGARKHSREHRDGYALSAPIGTFLPNAFGLHDMHGNVAEYCADCVVDPRAAPRPGDGARLDYDERLLSVRGGAFVDTAAEARSSAYHTAVRDDRSAMVGVRLARRIER